MWIKEMNRERINLHIGDLIVQEKQRFLKMEVTITHWKSMRGCIDNFL